MLANTIEKVGGILMISLLAKFLSVAEFGLFGIAFAYSLIINIFLYGGVQSVAFRCMNSTKDASRQNAIYWTIVTSLFWRSVIILLVVNFLSLFSDKIENAIGIPYSLFVMVVWIQCLLAPQVMQNMLWVATGKHFEIISLSAIKTLLILILCLTIYYFPSIELRFGGELIILLGLSIIIVVKKYRAKDPKDLNLNLDVASEINSLRSYGYSALVSQLSYLMISGVDRLMLGYMISAEAVAIYTVFSLSVSIIFLVNAFSTAFTSEYFKNFNHGKDPHKAYQLSVNVYLIGAGCIGIYKIILLVYAEEIIKVISTGGYSHMHGFIHLGADIVFFYFSYMIFSRQLHATGDGKSLMSVSIFAGLINLFLNLVLIKIYGVEGSVYASVIAYVLMALYVYIRARLKTPGFTGFLGDVKFSLPIMIIGVVNYCVIIA